MEPEGSLPYSQAPTTRPNHTAASYFFLYILNNDMAFLQSVFS